MGTRDPSFDYSRVDWRFAARIMHENSARLSRTRRGVSDTQTSPEKLPLLLSGDDLGRRSAENEQRVHQFVAETALGPPPQSGMDVRDVLFSIADLTNAGLLPAGRLRTWSTSYRPRFAAGGPVARVPHENLPEAVLAFSGGVFRRWPELEADPVPLYAWCEWQLNFGPLHPFYDGCGRIARAFGALLLIRASSLLPLYDSAQSYFGHGERGPEVFGEYVRERIGACADWVGRPPGPHPRRSSP
jgi:hypothetical protein